jgi:CheY-like chemotaxis protein
MLTLTETKLIDIIYAEDDEADRELFAEALIESKVNARLVTVENGQALIHYLGKNNPDIIFMDINMPMLNGIECLQALRRHSRFKKIPIIMLSTSAFEKDVEQAYADGANMYVVKPVSFIKQIENLKKIFSGNWREELFKLSREKFFLDTEQIKTHQVNSGGGGHIFKKQEQKTVTRSA